MMTDPSSSDKLKLPTAIENLGQTEYLGNFSSLSASTSITNTPSQPVQKFSSDRFSLESLSNISNASVQTKPDNSNVSSDSSNMGWSNISELLANLPPTKSSNNSSTSSLNKQKANSSDRSSLASSSTRSSTSSNNQQPTIQRSPDNTYTDRDRDQDLYLTPTGLQRGNPNQITDNPANTIQRKINDETLPEAKVSINPRQENESADENNFSQNLETLAQEIYILLKQRLEIERERQGARYQGRLPW